MILGNKQIIKEKNEGNILIKPFYEELLQGTSYDLRLDRFFEISECHKHYTNGII